MFRNWIVPFISLLLLVRAARGDGIGDNNSGTVRRLPKPGVEVPAEKKETLEAGLQRLRIAIEGLRKKNDPLTREVWPDVEVYHKAVHDALKYDEFFQPKEIDDAGKLLAIGQERAEQLLAGEAPWASATGLIVRGYVSKLDGSVQPYGLVVPASYSDRGPGGFRLDLWFHGRGEVLSELNFVRDRAANAGTFAPADTIVLHPYGRWNNAFKLAGEVDVLEALASVQRRYRVDDHRISVRGFSMGGAAAWHFAVHYADRWFAANPGAGFSETPEFLRFFQKEELRPAWFERKLWHLYDCTDWATNLRHCPTVAYSGDEDVQKQAADMMETALAREHLKLTHMIGPQTKHAYHPQSRDEVERRIASLATVGRERDPQSVHFVTYTLKYNRMHWVTVDGLEQHWERATVEALQSPGAEMQVSAQTTNVSDLTFDFPPGRATFSPTDAVRLRIDGQVLNGPHPGSDRSWRFTAHKVDGQWRPGARPETGLRKRHDLQGPIDDAFMDSFLFVRPTGKAHHEAVGKWSEAELARAIEHWRRHFRGEARVKMDSEVTPQDVASSHLILWGDAASNAQLAKIADKLPIQWTAENVTVAGKSYPASTHAVIAVYPNPQNPRRYVVLNSGFTFRDYAHLNNARQVPMLPDWAVVDLTTPPGNVWPGKITAAGFFDEGWQVQSHR